MALYLAEAGFDLVLVARSQPALEQLAADLSMRHGSKPGWSRDLAHEAGVETVESTTSDLDVGLLVAAAGFGTSGPFLDASIETELEMLDVNCRAVLEMSQHFGRRFARRGSGGLVLMSSIVGFQGTPTRLTTRRPRPTCRLGMAARIGLCDVLLLEKVGCAMECMG